MALASQSVGGGQMINQPVHDRKRVKVYELKNNDWYDRGTGFCTGEWIAQPPNAVGDVPDARIRVQSEDDPNRTLLETRINKDDGYQKQQDTLIVWTEANGVDMALSFQEAEGCSAIWEFVSDIQTRLNALAPDDGLSDDLLDPVNAIMLPDPQLGKLDEIENTMRAASTTPAARDALAKFVMSGEPNYILKLAPLVELAEEQENLEDLHRLCNIMKTLILLNDTSIIEHVVTDGAIYGVVGALEYDPDFPSHRANHRQYLIESSKFKEIVPLEVDEIRNKIHYTYRLLYLKDVVLARILDDPTFSVLNSLIFFHQVDIMNHLQGNHPFMQKLFAIFRSEDDDHQYRKKEAVLFIQNCCAVSKNIQAQTRAQLYQNFIQHGLFGVITFALRHHDASVRVAGTDVLVALIDHDSGMMRQHNFQAIKEKTEPLTDTLIELLLVEVDLGVKSQMADAIKILLDLSPPQGTHEMMRAGGGIGPKARGGGDPNGQGMHGGIAGPQTEQFIQEFYNQSAKRLFQPLKELEHRMSMANLTVQETSLYTHLVEVLCFFVRQHSYRSKFFILAENLHARIAQLLACPQKHMKLTALKWFRTCIGLQDEFHNRQLIQHRLFDPILQIVYETMPRDNLLNSACLELFEYIKREGVKQLLIHLVEQHRDRLMGITYVNTFQSLVLRYEQMMEPQTLPTNGTEDSSFTTQENTPHRLANGARYIGLKEMDPREEAYFDSVGDDDDDDDDDELPTPSSAKLGIPNGASPGRPLVSYADDDDDEDDDDDAMDLLASSPDPLHSSKKSSSDPTTAETDPDPDAMDEDPATAPSDPITPGSASKDDSQPSPPESIATKRRREEVDDDEIGKMMGAGSSKRRNSSSAASTSSQQSISGKTGAMQLEGAGENGDGGGGGGASANGAAPKPSHGHMLRRKSSLKTKNESEASAKGKFGVKPVSFKLKGEQGKEEGEGEGGGGEDG
ncbi:hypothetical protein MBLNU230_g7956t1 [Neophaeotheca triangularis]